MLAVAQCDRSITALAARRAPWNTCHVVGAAPVVYGGFVHDLARVLVLDDYDAQFVECL